MRSNGSRPCRHSWSASRPSTQLNKSDAESVTQPSDPVADQAANQVSYVEVPGGRIAYEVTGKAPLVVLSHGIGDLRQSYRFLMPLLVDPKWTLKPIGGESYMVLKPCKFTQAL